MRKFVRPGRRERAIGNNHRNRARTLVSSTALVAVSTLFAPAMPAQAQTIWTGATSTDWFTPSNWFPAVVPTAGTNVSIDTVNPNPTVIGSGVAASTVIFVGNQDTGQLTIQGGATLASGPSVVGVLAGSQGTVTVTGGSTWSTTVFVVGSLGSSSGTLTIENGGHVSSSGLSTIGRLSGAQGTVTVTGSIWDASGGLVVGDQGIGMLTVSDSGLVTSTGGAIGGFIVNSGTGQGTVTVTGAGSLWFNSGNLSVGNVGSTGTLIIANGGAVRNSLGIIGVGPPVLRAR
jgi:T5SS/PEP-CTERM-associated repeat protein